MTGPRTSPSVRVLALSGAVASVVAVASGSVAARMSGLPRWWPAAPAVVDVETIGTWPLLAALGAWFLAMISLAACWLLLLRAARDDRLATAGVLVILVAWSAPFAVGPPLGSRDVFSYASYGEIVAEGLDPYAVGPAALPDTVITDGVDELWADTPSVYGPGFLLATRGVVAVTGIGDYHAPVLGLRLVALVGLALAAAGVAAIARRRGTSPGWALALLLGNPVVLVHVVSGAHNEALMIAGIAVGVALATAGAWLVGVGVIAAAATIKVPAVVAAGFVTFWRTRTARGTWPRARTLLAGVAVTLAVLGGTGALAGVGLDWTTTLLEGTTVFSYLSVTSLVGAVTRLETAAAIAGLLVATAVTVRRLRPPDEDPGDIGVALLAIALLAPVVHPHYVLWGGVLLAAAVTPTRERMIVVPSLAMTGLVLPAAVGDRLSGLALVPLIAAAGVVVAAGAGVAVAVTAAFRRG